MAEINECQHRVSPLLNVQSLDAWYGHLQVLYGINLNVQAGEVVGLFGHNGAGKSTVLRCIVGAVQQTKGSICIGEQETRGSSTSEIMGQGVALVPQGVGIFGTLTVAENVGLGTHSAGNAQTGLNRVFEHLPVVREQWRQLARRLSGGQRQMVSIGRALMGETRLLLLDEPSIGLAPKLVSEVMDVINGMRTELGVGVLLVEQNVAAARKVIDRGYVIRQGRVVFGGEGAAFEDFHSLVEYF